MLLEVANIYNASFAGKCRTCTTPPTGMVSWWPAENNANDVAGQNNGTFAANTYAAGKVGQAFSLNGTDAYVQVPDSPSLHVGTGEITIDAWINAPAGNTPRSIVDKSGSGPNYPDYLLTITDDNKVEFFANDCGTGACGFGTTELPVRSLSVVADGTFHHVAGVRRANGDREIWVDGVRENTRNENNGNTDSSGPVIFGLANGVFFNGLIDEVEIFNRALSPGEITAIADAGNAGKCPFEPATHFLVSAPASATAGAPFNFTVTALDQFNNTATGYRGTAHFTKSDSGAGSSVPADYVFTASDNGVHTFSATLVTAGNQTVTATDTVNSSITGSSNISVGAAAATHFLVSAPASATAGVSFNFTVTAQDQFNNTATAYAGTVHFTKSDSGPGSAVPADYTFVGGDNGSHVFSATLVTSGTQTITATDTVTSSITGTSNSIVVGPAAATHFAVSAPANATAGQSFNFTVTAQDQFNNTATGYSGTVTFTKSDSGGGSSVPANYTFVAGDNGAHTFFSDFGDCRLSNYYRH